MLTGTGTYFVKYFYPVSSGTSRRAPPRATLPPPPWAPCRPSPSITLTTILCLISRSIPPTWSHRRHTSTTSTTATTPPALSNGPAPCRPTTAWAPCLTPAITPAPCLATTARVRPTPDLAMWRCRGGPAPRGLEFGTRRRRRPRLARWPSLGTRSMMEWDRAPPPTGAANSGTCRR